MEEVAAAAGRRRQEVEGSTARRTTTPSAGGGGQQTTSLNKMGCEQAIISLPNYLSPDDDKVSAWPHQPHACPTKQLDSLIIGGVSSYRKFSTSSIISRDTLPAEHNWTVLDQISRPQALSSGPSNSRRRRYLPLDHEMFHLLSTHDTHYKEALESVRKVGEHNARVVSTCGNTYYIPVSTSLHACWTPKVLCKRQQRRFSSTYTAA